MWREGEERREGEREGEGRVREGGGEEEGGGRGERERETNLQSGRDEDVRKVGRERQNERE